MSRRNTSKYMEVSNGLSGRGACGSTAVLVVDPSRPGTEEGGARAGVERLDREGVVSASWRGDPCLRHSTNERSLLVGGGTDEIFGGLQRGDSMRGIARTIGRAPSTVSRELRRNGRPPDRRRRAATSRASWD